MRLSAIYIGLIPLLTAAALAWSAFAAPCMELGLFWASVASAIAVALTTWRTSGRIGQKGMLLVYVSLAASLILATTALVDSANVTFLGEMNDAETGILLGGVLAFLVVGWIAVRLSERFPSSLAWGSAVASLSAWGVSTLFGKAVEPDYQHIITMAGLGTALIAFILLFRCRHNLNGNQYISVLSVISVFTMFSAPSSSVNLFCSILASLVILLSGMLILGNWQHLLLPQRIAASMLLYVGFSGCMGEILEKGLHLNETLSVIPACLLLLVILALIRRYKEELERGQYWAASFAFGAMMLMELVPKSSSSDLFLAVVGILSLFITACIIYAPVPLPARQYNWKKKLGHAGAAVAALFVIAITAAWLTTALTMLTTNTGPVRLLALLKPTHLWPGDNKFIELVMREESLWPDEVRTLAAGDGEPTEDYLERIRPDGDRFSNMMSARSYKNMQRGIDDEDIGVQWASGRNQFLLKRVYRQSPAGEAGLERGDRVIAINGKLLKDIPDDASWEKVFDHWKTGAKISMNVLDRGGKKRDVSLTIGTSVQDQPMSRIITMANGPVGYLYLEGFSRAQFKDIRKHFAAFKKEGVNCLVLDLRYNGGGFINNASVLTDLIAGQILDGRPFVRLEHSERFHDRNTDYVFERLPESPHIKQIVILTTRETCSASEAVISGLKPHMPVTVVGSQTCGKPFSMYSLEFGENIILPVTARVINSRGEGYYSRGIKPDIPAKDDLTHQLGDPEEGMLKKALEIVTDAKRFN